MPFRRGNTRKRKAPYNRRRRLFRKKRAATTTIVRAPSAFSDRTIVKLNYVDLHTFTASTLTNYVYRGNDCYDPYFPVGGHQPMGFDQYMLIYNKFTVLGSSIHVELASNNAGGSSLTVRPSLSSTVPTYQYEAWERPRTSFKSGGHTYHFVIKKYSSTAQVTGEKRNAITSEDNFSGTAAASPTNQWYWQILVNPDSGASTSYYMWVRLVVYVVFHDRKPLVLS